MDDDSRVAGPDYTPTALIRGREGQIGTIFPQVLFVPCANVGQIMTPYNSQYGLNFG